MDGRASVTKDEERVVLWHTMHRKFFVLLFLYYTIHGKIGSIVKSYALSIYACVACTFAAAIWRIRRQCCIYIHQMAEANVCMYNI